MAGGAGAAEHRAAPTADEGVEAVDEQGRAGWRYIVRNMDGSTSERFVPNDARPDPIELGATAARDYGEAQRSKLLSYTYGLGLTIGLASLYAAHKMKQAKDAKAAELAAAGAGATRPGGVKEA